MSAAPQSTVLEVRRDDWAITRIVHAPLPESLADGQILFKVDRFAVTSNNISYAGSGDALGYWRFFPAEAGWGRIPAMGWADVVASAHPEVAVGERVWGFFPFGTHLLVNAGKVKRGAFADVSPHREGLAPVYAQFDRAAANPLWEPDREDQDSLLRGLFMTSWLVEDFLNVNDGFAARDCLITSASSKTSIALAHAVKTRGQLESVALTSPRNVDFCRGLGCYDRVLSYADIGGLDASRPVVLVDMAGSAEIIAAAHHRFADNMKYSCRIGATHYTAAGSVHGLPGATPTFFFAPHHIQTRSAELGGAELMIQLGTAYAGFRVFCDSWLRVEVSRGPDAAERVYREVLAGSSNPAVGHVVSMAVET